MTAVVLLALVVAAAVTAVLAAALLPRLEGAGLRRPNYRGRPVATGLGVVVPAGLLAGTAVLALVGGAGFPAVATGDGAPGPVRPPLQAAGDAPPFQLLAAVAVAGLAGLLDDLLGDPVRGWRGHLGEAARGRFTAGQMKILVLGLAALALGPTAAGPATRLAAAGVMAGCANGLNLLDRRPGRALKAFFLGWLALGSLSPAAALQLLPLAGAALVLLPLDLAERAMLGDAGSNALGAGLGWALAAHLPPPALAAFLAALVLLHVLAEFRSLTTLIEAVPPLRWLDGLGRR